MRSVKVNVAQALEIVRNNREQHREIFEEALEGYRQKMIVHLNLMIEEIRKGNRVEHSIRLPQPVDQTKEYDRAIKMLEMSVDKEVELDETSFANFIMDDWSWSDQFLMTNSNYSAKAASIRK